MGAKHLLSAIVFALLCAVLVRADGITEPGHFIINLNDDCSTEPTSPDCTVTDGSGGWGADTVFTDVVNTVTSTEGFIEGVLYCGDPPGNHNAVSSDPSIRLDAAGGSIAFPASFMSDEEGGGILDFQNDSGSPYKDILITTNFLAGQVYTCSSDIYAFCGFDVIHENNGPNKFEILFADGTIPIATPEPSQYISLLIAFGAVVAVYRLRAQAASE